MPPIKKMVVEWLNEVNYADDSLYIPSDFALEFVNFIKVLNGEDQEEHNTPVVHYRMLDQVAGPKENIINLCARGLAKSLPLTSKVFTQTGRCTIADLQIGDSIAGADGIFTPVIAKSKIFHKIMYKIHLADGRYQVVSEDHINSVIHKRKVRYGKQSTTEYQKRNLTIKEILQYTLRAVRKVTAKNPTGFETNFWIPNTKAIKYNTKDFPLDPYTLGVILGDGSICKETGYVRIHGHKDDFPHYHKNIPYIFGRQYIDKRNTNVLTQGILKVGDICKKLGINVHGDFKFIPEIYLYGSIEQRLALLQGLMDTDGTCYSNGGVAFCSNSYKLAKGVQDLVRSLGGIAKMGTTGKAFRVNIRCNFSVFKLIRKKEREHTHSVEKVGIHAITEIPTVPSQCIAVDNIDHTFLIDEYTVTHNTTLMCQYLILYIAVYGSIPGYGRIDYALYVADAIENNVKKMRLRLEMFCNNKAFLKTYLSAWKFTDVRWYFKNKEGKEFVVSGHGAQSGVRGTVELGTRPQLALLDDLLGDADAKSPTIIKSIENTVYKAIEYALHPQKRKTIWCGTPFNAKDPLYKAVESGAWYVNVYPICNEFPCKKENFKGAWPDRFDYAYVLKAYTKALKNGELASFNQELMLRIMSEEDRLIQDNDINWYRLSDISTRKAAFNFYITTDFATSEATASDNSVILVWAVNSKGWWFLVDGICKRQLMDKNVDDLFRLAQKWKPQQVGIEVSGQQGGFIPWIQREMAQKNVWFTLASENNNGKQGIRPVTNKMVRFNLVVPWFKSGQMHFPTELKELSLMAELINELSLASPSAFRSKHDDCIDAISMLSSLTIWLPSEDVTMVQSEGSDMWEIDDDEAEDTLGINSYIV